MSVTRLFLDATGSAPMSTRTVQAWQASLAQGWADPRRIHAPSRQSRALEDSAREAIAEVLDVPTSQTHFTASPHLGLERVIGGIMRARRGRDRILVSAVERDAALQAAQFVAPHGVEVLPVDSQGHVSITELRVALEVPDVAMVVVQHANQEIGTIQDLAQVHAVTQAAGVPLVVDATASIGHVPAPTHWDALVAHPADWGGPGGIGVVAVRQSTRWLHAWPEGDDWAPGGVNVPLALASAVALQERRENMDAVAPRLHGYVDRLRAEVSTLEGVHLVGDPHHRLPHVLTFAFLYLDGEPLLSGLDRAGIAVGSGSACAVSTVEPSHVLAALGALTHGNIRLGLHPAVDDGDIDRFLEVLPRVVDEVRSHLTR
ncbi:MAG: aminotransferase class V-fold PLP-dependent enzyme [Demequina sp.]